MIMVKEMSSMNFLTRKELLHLQHAGQPTLGGNTARID